jgi:methionyl-tRNA synthetase
MSRQYVTTAIDYPNAAPHMGHVLEKVLADVMVRWFRLRGDEVRFQIGTDEHGIKIQQTAEKEKLTPKALVDRNVPLFKDLYSRLGISADIFIRTSDQKVHWPTVQALWKKLADANTLEKRTRVLHFPAVAHVVPRDGPIDGEKTERVEKSEDAQNIGVPQPVVGSPFPDSPTDRQEAQRHEEHPGGGGASVQNVAP